MKANELKSLKKGYFFSCKIPKPHSHYKMAMTKGFYFPGTRSQARHFLKNGNLGLLNFDDVERVEAMLNKHGYEGNYKYTKNKKFIFLKNKEDLNNALRKEFNLPKTETVSIPPPVRTTFWRLAQCVL